MKLLLILNTLLLSSVVLGQSQQHKDKFRELEPDIWMGIWDAEHSSNTIKFDTIGYDDIPKNLDFRGTVVEAIKWTDLSGVNILIQTVTGHFNWKDYHENSDEYMIQDKSELYAYLFTKKPGKKDFIKIWRIYDYTECFGVDWFTGFIPKATTITDLDNDGVSEISVPYVSICRGGVDPGTMKIIMYEGDSKYALRGLTMTFCSDQNKVEGTYTPSKNLESNPLFMEFLNNRWEAHKCERDRFY
ncbi:MAG: hypothetical protein KDD41_05870 [Flavobacteriales bacterium]|nr:hypothetical protein [Flavobacteriales bacterium]